MSEQIEARDVQLILKYCSRCLEKARKAIDRYLEKYLEPSPLGAIPKDETTMRAIREIVSSVLRIESRDVESQRVEILLRAISERLGTSNGQALYFIDKYLKSPKKRIPGAVKAMEVEIRPELVKVKEIIDFCLEEIELRAPGPRGIQ